MGPGAMNVSQTPSPLDDYLARFGVGNDNAARGGMVAHIGAKEAQILKSLGGSGTINPHDGLPQFDSGDGGGDGGGGDGGGDGGGTGGGGDSGNGGDTPNYIIPGGSITTAAVAPPAPPAAPTWAAPGSIGNLAPVDYFGQSGGHHYKGDDNNYYFRGDTAGNNDAIGSAVNYQDILGKAKQGAEGEAARAATNRGLDPNSYKSLFDTEIDRILGGTPQFATDLRNPFGQDFGNSTLDKEQNRLRTGYQNAATNTFSPTYATGKVPDTFDDSVIDNILGQQFGDAKTLLDNSHARGNLNDIGYNAGLGELGTQKTSGYSALQGYGGKVLSGYRDQLNSIGQQAKTSAGGFTLGTNYNLGDFTGQADSKLGQFSQTLEGDVRNAAPSNLFDTSKILGRGGSAQGAQNEGRGLFDVLASRNKTAANARGVGTQGTF